jgi:hypothetical protein
VVRLAGPEAPALVRRQLVDGLARRVGDVGNPVRKTGQLLGDARAVVELGARRLRLAVGLHRRDHRAVTLGLRGATPATARQEKDEKQGK